MKSTVIILASLHIIVQISDGEGHCPKEPYNKYKRPHAGGPAVNVTAKLYVRNLNSIDESGFTYNLDYILYYYYNDPRLAENCSSTEFLQNVRKTDDIWFPLLGLINCHSSKNVLNSEKVRIAANGDIFADIRTTTQCYCIMDLTAFPMDTQHCPFILESYIYSTRDIRLNWHPQPIQFEEGLELVGYKQGKAKATKVAMVYSYGTWEVLKATFVFQRMFLHFIYRVYIPIILLMIFNFASYWVPFTAMPARVTLIITTFLTITFILQSVSAQTAKATTTTSLQIFLIFSVIVVVVAIMELLVCMYLKTMDSDEASQHKVAPVIENTNIHPYDPNDIVADVSSQGADTNNSANVVSESRKRLTAEKLDKVFRNLVPMIYALFCMIYFSIFLNYH